MSNKLATTQVAIHDIIAKRWSPRAYDADKAVSRKDLLALLEAARWAPSCFGEEPWRYVVCDKHSDPLAWDKAFECLAEGNQGWAKNVPILILSVASDLFISRGTPNRWAQYDTGAACENLCLQAAAQGLAAHQMGGFDPDKAREAFNIPDGYTCMSMITIGYQANPEILEKTLQEREQAPRTRKPLGSLFFEGVWETPVKQN